MSFLQGSAPMAAAWVVLVSFHSAAAPAVEQVTVKGERVTATAPGIEAARAQAARVPGGVNIVGNEAYAGGRASNLLDMFARVPGVYVQPRFGAEEARLSIRGSGLQRTFHLRGIYLLQDGVPLTLADGGGDFQAVEPMALAYTEVLRGANALQYGGITLGGSIHFVSPSGYDGAGAHPRLEAGSFGYRRLFASFGAARAGAERGNLTDYFVAASGYEQDGFRDWSRQENVRLSGNFGLRLSDVTESRVYFAGVHSDSQLPGSLTHAQLAADPAMANAGALANRHKRDYDLYRLAVRTVHESGSGSIEWSLSYSYKDLWHPIFQVFEQRSHDYAAGLRYLGAGELGRRESRWVIGISPSWNTVEDDRFVNVSGRRGTRTAQSRQRSRNLAAYAEHQLDLDARWTLVSGAQWTRAERRLLDRFLANGDQSLDTQYRRLSPKLGVLWRGEGWTVYGNGSDSFEPPSFGELSGGAEVDLLNAQRARTLELGSRGRAGRWAWDVAAYHARVSGELLSLNTPAGQSLGTVNAPRTVHRGIEGSLGVTLAPGWSLQTLLLLNDFKFDGHGTYGDNPLPGLPTQLYRSELSWTFRPAYTLALTGEWSPERYAVDMANSWFADGYALLGAKLTRSPARGMCWFLEGRNLADRRYAAATGVIADARGRDTAQFLPGDGRAVYAGFEWRWQ